MVNTKSKSQKYINQSFRTKFIYNIEELNISDLMLKNIKFNFRPGEMSAQQYKYNTLLTIIESSC